MAYKEVPKPAPFRGTEAERWEQLRRYLWKLAEQLEAIVNNMAEGADDNGE